MNDLRSSASNETMLYSLINNVVLTIAIWNVHLFGEVQSTDPPAQWMSGKFGMGFRIGAGDYIERRQTNGNDWGLDWSQLVAQFTEVGASWVIVNLSEGAYGTTWMAYHPVLYDINTPPDASCVPYLGSPNGWDGQCQTAPTPSNTTDYFKEMTDAFHAANIKVIAYVASQGPAMFKAGSGQAFDVKFRSTPLRPTCTATSPNNGPSPCFANPDNCCSPSMGNWIKYVKNLNGDTIDYPKLHTAFADVIIDYYAEKYKNDIDGWWFDHAQEASNCGAGSTCRKDFIDKTAVRNAIRTHQPNVPIAFNTCSNAQKSPLQICATGFEDFTAGHPKPLGGGNPTLPFESGNYPMVTSVEGTPDGFFDSSGWKSLGHVFMPTGSAWNGPTIPNVWTTPYPYTTAYNANDPNWSVGVTNSNGWNPDAEDWFTRVLARQGAWTWNLPRYSNSPNTYFLLHPNHLEIVKEAVSSLVVSPTTQAPTLAQTSSPTSSPTPSPTPSSPTSSSSAPTSIIQTWFVGSSSLTTDPANIFDSSLQILNPIGNSIQPGNVQVQLFDYGCQVPKNSTGLVVSLQPSSYVANNFSYSVFVNKTLIGQNIGGFVNFIDDGNNSASSKGEISFCTRVSAYHLGVHVSYHQLDLKLLFDLTENSFILSTVNIEQNDPSAFSTDVTSSFGVMACQCNDDYQCYSTIPAPNPTINQNENLVMCIYPTSTSNDASSVQISNFNVGLSAPGVTYDPVAFGPSGWIVDALSIVSLQSGTETIKISAPVVASFFIQNHQSIDVSGNAFLEYKSGKNDDLAFTPFQMEVSLARNMEIGCFATILQSILQKFR